MLGGARPLLVAVATALILGGWVVGVAAAGTGPRVATLSVSVSATPSFGSAPLLVGFQASVSTGTPTAYNWSFGDGTFLNGSAPSDGHPSHLYTGPGNFTATVVVREGTDVGNASVPVHVSSSPIDLSVDASPRNGTAPLTVTFSSSVSGGTGTYVAFNWTFGDGNLGSGATVQYTYLRAGDYYAQLTVEDSGGGTAKAGVWVNLTADGPAGNAQVTGLGTLGWGIVGFSVGVVVAVVAFAGWTWAVARRPGPAVASPPVEPPPPSTPPAAPAQAPTTEPLTPTPTRAEEAPEPLRISQRIVLHLAAQGGSGPYDVAPPGATQAGMSSALGVRQNGLTNVLRRLEDGGILEAEVRHVVGQPRRLKTYRLTPRGELLARELRHRPPRGPAD